MKLHQNVGRKLQMKDLLFVPLGSDLLFVPLGRG
jgi:hypothetical protein